MLAARLGLSGAVLALAVVLQVAVFAPMRLPGATPDVMILAVLGIALRWGSTSGAVAGFVGGLLLDAAPPSDSTLGRWALVATIIGFLAGKAALDVERSAVVGPLVVLLGSIAATTGNWVLGVLLSDPRVDAAGLASVLPAAVLYDIVLAPFLVWGVYRLAGRIEVDLA